MLDQTLCKGHPYNLNVEKYFWHVCRNMDIDHEYDWHPVIKKKKKNSIIDLNDKLGIVQKK